MRSLKKAMSDFYKNCIFCLKPLPGKRQDEHVIPKNINGFWTIDMICNECMEHFGKNVDQLSIKDIRILKAMDYLGFKVNDKYRDLPYKAQDTIGSGNVKMILKNDRFKVKTSVRNDFLEIPTEDFDIIGINWLRKGNKLSKKEFDEETNRVKIKIQNLNIGDNYYSEKLGCYFINRQATKVKIDTENIPSVTPLIAKIVICLLFSFIPARQIINLKESEMLRSHARYNEKLNEGIIYSIMPISKKQYGKYHFIRLKIYKNAIEINIIFFGHPSWLIKLHGNNEILIPFKNDGRIEEVNFIFDFKDKREAIIYIKCLNSNEIYHGVFPAYK